MNQHKVTQYFKYAIGEIILVMIGILLALQVNSWYQNSKDRKLELSLLKELKQTIISDKENYEWNVSNFEKIVSNSNYLDSIIRNRGEYSPKIDSAFGIISAFSITEANYVPFDKITNMENGIIKNDSLFNSMSNYYNFSKFISGVDRYFQVGAYFRQQVYPKFFSGYRYGSYAKITNFEKILNSDEIKVAIDYARNDSKYYLGQSKHRVDHASELIDIINNELKRFD